MFREGNDRDSKFWDTFAKSDFDFLEEEVEEAIEYPFLYWLEREF